MAYTVRELIEHLRDFMPEYSDRNVLIGGRWGISELTGPGDNLGMAVEVNLEDVGIDDKGRASLFGLFRYLSEQPEYRDLPFGQRAQVLSLLLPMDSDQALALGMAAIERRRSA